MMAFTAKWQNTSRSRTYLAWRNMRSRCLNPAAASFKHYGARGITICPQWVEDYDQFFADMGEVPPGLSLERVDNNAGYSPENCIWVSLKEQLNNRRLNVNITHQGRTLTIGQWATELGVHYDTLWRRIQRYGMTPEKALTDKSLKAAGWEHGTRTGYCYGCRCELCKASNTARCRAQRAKRLA